MQAFNPVYGHFSKLTNSQQLLNSAVKYSTPNVRKLGTETNENASNTFTYQRETKAYSKLPFQITIKLLKHAISIRTIYSTIKELRMFSIRG